MYKMKERINSLIKSPWLFSLAATLCILCGHYLGHGYKIAVVTPHLVQKINADINLIADNQRAAFEQADGTLSMDYLAHTNKLLRQQNIGLELVERLPQPIVAVQHDLIPYGVNIQHTNYNPPWLLMIITSIFSGLVFSCFQPCFLLDKQSYITEHIKAPIQVLTINLDRRLLTLGNKKATTPLANKPLCLYIAMLKYCSETKQPFLTTNEPLPGILNSSCQRLFTQLMEKGHTKRRPPDFDSALDKSLSDIRRVVDGLCEGDTDLQRIFVPPKAVGKGARLQRHNFALKDINQYNYKIISD